MRTIARYDPYDPGVLQDPYPSYAWLLDEAPVYRLEEPAVWVLSRHDDVSAALKRPAVFSSAHGVSFGEGGGSGTLVAMDAPDHTRLRRILAVSFTQRAIARFEPEVNRVVAELVAAIAGSEEVDVVEEFTAPLPTRVVAALLGIDPEDWRLYKRWSDVLNAQSWAHDPAERTGPAFLAAAMEAAAFFADKLDRRRAVPSDDLISVLVQAQQEAEAVTDAEIVSFCVLLLLAGNVTTSALMANSLCLLADHPEVLARLQADPLAIPTAVEELTRYVSPVQGFCRTLTEDVELHGQRMAEGDQVLLLFGAANRDPRVFPDPDVLDIGRDPNPHVGFGAGAHLCLGRFLARLEVRVALSQLTPRLVSVQQVANDPLCRVPLSSFRDISRAPLRLVWA